MKRTNYIGRRFSNLTVISNAPDYVYNGRKFRMVHCKCECGNEKTIKAESLVSGRTTSCGCNQIKSVIKRNTKHGLQGDPLYTTWKGMRERCSNHNQKHHRYYSDKGISVCKEWDSFDTFRKWALEHGWKKGLQVDRINCAGNYSPSNCRIVTRKINSQNKTNVIQITIEGVTMCQSEWCRLFNIRPASVISIARKLNISRAQAIEIIRGR